ncbi:MAG: recombinase family protein [Desulfomonile tiedjei]|nr:recombinase family protein [Desulfomonile tiedjei]
MSIASYVRVSTQDQEARGTYVSQINAINAFCAARGLQVNEWFQEQESTLNLDRPEFRRLIEGLQTGTITTVVVAALDRFSRNQIETLQAIELFKERQANFYCIRENITIIDGKADFASEMIISVLSLFAKNERETIKVRTVAGKKRKTEKGLWVNGQAPVGYELDRQSKILKINSEEAAVVRRIWDEKLAGRGVNAILKSLTMDGIPMFEQRVKFAGVRSCQVIRRERSSAYCRIRTAHADYQGCSECIKQHGGDVDTKNLWAKSTVTKALKNMVYLGFVPVADDQWIAGLHEPLVTKDEWDKVQTSFVERYARKNKVYPNNPLAGLVRCGRCGRKMFVTTAGAKTRRDGSKGYEWAAFRCPGHKGGCCSQGSISVRIVQEEVYNYLDQMFLSDEVATRLQSSFERLLQNWTGETADVPALEQEISTLEGERKKLVAPIAEAIDKGFMELYRTLMDKASALDIRIKGLRKQISLSKLHSETQRHELEKVSFEEIFAGAVAGWGAARQLSTEGPSDVVRTKTGELVSEVVRSFVRGVTVDGREVEVEPYFSEEWFEEAGQYLLYAVIQIRQHFSMKTRSNVALYKDITSL